MEETQPEQIKHPVTPLPEPIEEVHKELFNFKKFSNILVWGLLILFAPITVLILISQNSLPGDPTYSVKRGLENVVLQLASLNPSTRVLFHTDLADRRFDEAQKMILARSDASALTQFLDEVKVTQKEINAVTDPKEKATLAKQLDEKVTKYVTGLEQSKQQVIAQEQSQKIAANPTGVINPQENQAPSPTQAFLATNQLPPTQSPLSDQSTQLQQPTNTPVPVPTSLSGRTSLPTNTPVPLPTFRPTSVPTSGPQPSSPTPRFPTPTTAFGGSSPTHIPTPLPTHPLLTPTTVPSGRPTATPSPTRVPTPTPMPVSSGGGGTCLSCQVGNGIYELCRLNPNNATCIALRVSLNSAAGAGNPRVQTSTVVQSTPTPTLTPTPTPLKRKENPGNSGNSSGNGNGRGNGKD